MLHFLARRGAAVTTVTTAATARQATTTLLLQHQHTTCTRRTFAAAAAAAAGDKVLLVNDYKTFSDKTSTAERVIAYFTASWCPPCRTISPVFSSLSEKHPGVTFLKVDVDENEEAASKANIRTIPAFHFFRKGKLVGSFAGADQKKLTESVEDLEAKP